MHPSAVLEVAWRRQAAEHHSDATPFLCLLAIFAELAKALLALNEIAETRAGLLGRLFRDVAVSRHNAEQVHDPVPDLLGLEIAIDCGRGNASTATQAASMAATQAAGTGRAPRCPCRRPRDDLRIVECRGCSPPPRLDQRRFCGRARLNQRVDNRPGCPVLNY